MAAATETRLGAAPPEEDEPPQSHSAVQRDEDQPQDHNALQTAIYINALIMVYADYRS